MTAICEQCGGRIPAESPLGLCPRCCLLGLGLERPPAGRDGIAIPGLELGKSIGRGGFGDVYEAVQLQAGFRRVAVKILRDEDLGAARRARFQEEMHLLSLLDHPHIARLLGAGVTTGGQPYYLMELVEGRPFNQWAAGATDPEKIRVLRQAAEAVAHAHRQGIVHRDLKPSNLLVTDGGEPSAKVIDFGIARALAGPALWGREATAMEQRLGTPLYMSPEQLAGDPRVDTRSDVWSLGLLIHEAFLGRPALAGVVRDGASWLEHCEAVRHHVFPPLAQKEVGWIARKACAPEPEDRYATMEELAADLRAIENGEPVSVGSAYPAYRMKKWLARHRGRAVAGGVLGASLILVAGAGWWASAKSNRALRLAGEARAQSLVHASDAALHLASRSMLQGKFAEAADHLDTALQLSPANTEAAYARSFLRTTVPFARELGEMDPPEPMVAVAADTDGSFVLRGKGGALHRLALPGKWSAAGRWPEQTPPDGPIMVEILPSGEARFTDRESGSVAMAPLVFGSGAEPAAWNPRSGQFLAIGTNGKTRIWDVSRMRRAYERVEISPHPRWMGFERNTGSLWMIDDAACCRKWPAGAISPDASFEVGAFRDGVEIWKAGEGHNRGLLPNGGGVAAFLHIAAWHALGTDRRITCMAQARERDLTLFGGTDTPVRSTLALQKENNLPARVRGFREIPDMLAIDALGLLGAVVDRKGSLHLIDPATSTVTRRIEPGAPVSSLTVLDGGKDVVLAHPDGTISVFDPVLAEWRWKQRPLLGLPGAKSGVQVRAVPGRRRFFCRADGDVQIYRFDAMNGEACAPPLRHERGVQWFCAEGDFLFSIDQAGELPGMVRIWSLRTHREIVPALVHPAPLRWATVLDQGKRIATADTRGVVRRWVLTDP